MGAVLVAGLSAAAVVFALRATGALHEPVQPSSVAPASDAVWRRAIRWLGERSVLRRPARPSWLATRLVAAGSDRSVEEVVGGKSVLAFGATVAAILFTPAPIALALLVGLGAFLIPDLLLSRAARRRRALAEREMPILLDLLAVTATAGLGGQLAMRRAAEATQGPLADALRIMIRRVDLGGRWRDELVDVAERLDLPDLRRAASVLTRSETIGSTYADALAEIARDAREAHRTAAAERARKAPVKMLFPLVFLVLPAFLLLTVVPVLVTTLRSIR